MWNVEEHAESVVSGRPLPKTHKEKQNEKRVVPDASPLSPAELPGARKASYATRSLCHACQARRQTVLRSQLALRD